MSDERDGDIAAGPHAWLQWKGTDACMDVRCSCGHHGHVDADFAYFYRCVGCGKVWTMGAHVRLHEPSEEEQRLLAGDAVCEPVSDHGEPRSADRHAPCCSSLRERLP